MLQLDALWAQKNTTFVKDKGHSNQTSRVKTDVTATWQCIQKAELPFQFELIMELEHLISLYHFF